MLPIFVIAGIAFWAGQRSPRFWLLLGIALVAAATAVSPLGDEALKLYPRAYSRYPSLYWHELAATLLFVGSWSAVTVAGEIAALLLVQKRLGTQHTGLSIRLRLGVAALLGGFIASVAGFFVAVILVCFFGDRCIFP